MIEEVLSLICTLIAGVSDNSLTAIHSIDTLPAAPPAQRRPVRDPFALSGAQVSTPSSSQAFVQPTIPSQPDYPQAVLSFDQSANQVLQARPVLVHSRDAQTGKKVLKQVNLGEIISRSAQREGIDPKLVEIVIEHESAFDPQAASGVGACGLMQLMPETAKELGVTDLNDPEQNVAAGTKYLAQQIRHYQSLPLALAAYNAGPGNVDYYGDVPPFEETQNYSSSITSQYKSCRVAR